MTQPEYLELIINGYVNHADYLDKYFYRASKEAEIKHIDFLEFFERLAKAYDILIKKRDDRYYEDLHDFYTLIDNRKAKGISIDNLEGQRPLKSNYSINLIYISMYAGHLFENDLAYILNAMLLAWNKSKAENAGETKDERIEDISDNIMDKGSMNVRKVILFLHRKYGYEKTKLIKETQGVFNWSYKYIDNNVTDLLKYLKNNVDVKKPLTDGEMQTWEDYNEEIQEPEFEKKFEQIKKQNRIKPS